LLRVLSGEDCQYCVCFVCYDLHIYSPRSGEPGRTGSDKDNEHKKS